MLGRLNHVAIAVKDAEQAAKIYGAAFGAEISKAVPLPEHGVTTVFVTLPNTKIEFIRSARPRRSQNSSSAMPTAASIMSAMRFPTSSPRAIR
jgi:catechol 2,3-dioxygenase-like lactoylglutathione lyase family enzyme